MNTNFLQIRMKRIFNEGFTVLDISETLVSFDADKDAAETKRFMSKHSLDIVGIRKKGLVAGYIRCDDLTDGKCSDHMRSFDDSLVLSATSSIQDVLEILAESEYCFVSVLGKVGGVVTRHDIQKPPFRMWLFGMITIMEMYMVRAIETQFPDDSWQDELSDGRQNRAKEILKERKRRNQTAKLIDCLQFSDKASILIKDQGNREDFGFQSMRAAKNGIKAIESLRNNLSHAQDILTYDWEIIVATSKRLDIVMTRLNS
jgi:hypothetical protein